MSETTTVPLGQLRRNDYNWRTAPERHGSSVEIDVDSLGDSIEDVGLDNRLTVRSLGNRLYEVVTGERRFRALREKFDDDYLVKVEIEDLTRAEAIQRAMAENEEREDLTTMQEAWGFAESVTIEADGEPMSYAEYVENLQGHDPIGDLQVPSKHDPGVKTLHEATGRSITNISERLSFLLLPEEAHDWIDEGSLPKRAARLIVRRVRNGKQSGDGQHEGVKDVDDALGMMADLAEIYGGPDSDRIGIGDYDDLEADIKNRIEDYQRKKEIAEEEVEELADLVFDRVGTLSEHLDAAFEQFDVLHLDIPIPNDPDSPRDIDFEAIGSCVNEYRQNLKSQRESIIETRRDFDDKIDNIETANSRIKQALRQYDEDHEQCVYCLQPLDGDRLQDVLSDNREEISQLEALQDEKREHVSALHDVQTELHRDLERIDGARESYTEAYEVAREFDEDGTEVAADD